MTTTEELIKACTIDLKVMVIEALKSNIKTMEKEARDREMSKDYRDFYKKMLKTTRAHLRKAQAELNELRTA